MAESSARERSRRNLRDVELAPHWDVVRRFGPATFGLVDADGGQVIGGLWRQQQMVDPEAISLLPCAGLIIPEGVVRALDVEGAHRVGQAQIEQCPQRGARLRLAERVTG